MKKYFTFDDEPITGWSFFWRNLLGIVGLMLFILPGLWIWAANGYKRAGAFRWSKEMRITCAIGVVVAEVSNILTQMPEYMEAEMNPFDYIAIPCAILTFILLVKNGNKNIGELPKKGKETTDVKFEEVK